MFYRVLEALYFIIMHHCKQCTMDPPKKAKKAGGCYKLGIFFMKHKTMQWNELKLDGFKEKCGIRLKMYDGSNQNCSNMLQCSNLLNYFHTGTKLNAHPPSLASLSNLKESALNRRGVCKKEGDLEPLMCFPLWCLWLYNKGMHHRGYKKHCMTLRDVMSHQKEGGRRLKGCFIQFLT